MVANSAPANPAIAPEEKVGWDAGFELYWGNKASLALTHFDEEARNLIRFVDLDPTASPRVRQYQNIGVVEMQGWEVEGKVSLGRVTLEANYAYSDNVIRKVTDVVAADPNAIFQVGDRTPFAPKHSGGGRFILRFGRGSASLDASVMDDWRAFDAVAFFDRLYGGVPYRGSTRAYYVSYSNAIWKWNLGLEQSVTDRLTAFLRVDNLANGQDGGYQNIAVTPGRTTAIGFRFAY